MRFSRSPDGRFLPSLTARSRQDLKVLPHARATNRATGDGGLRSQITRSGDPDRKRRNGWTGAATGFWISLVAAGTLAAGPQAAAAPPSAMPKSAPLPATPFAYQPAMNSDGMLRSVTSGSKPGQIVGEDLFAHSGNRNGLTSAVGVETRGADLWLAAPAPAPAREAPSPRREVAPAASQGSPSSITFR